MGTTLAIDLGTTTGWAISRADGSVVSGSECFKPRRMDSGFKRFALFWELLERLQGDHGPIEAAHYELVRNHLGTQAAHIYGGFEAVLGTWCHLRDVSLSSAEVGEIKRYATGFWQASKQQVIAAMRALGHNPSDDNEADALAILYHAISKMGGN